MLLSYSTLLQGKYSKEKFGLFYTNLLVEDETYHEIP